MTRLCLHVLIGATLTFSLGTVALGADVTSEWLGGGGNWTDPSHWSTAQYPHNTTLTYHAVIDSDSYAHVTVDDDVTVDSFLIGTGERLTLDNRNDLTLAHGPSARTITNRGTLSLASAGSTTYLYFYGTVTLDGGGTVTLTDTDRNRIVGEGEDAVPHLINQDNTIRGAGWIGQAYTKGEPTFLTNAGVIEANQSAALTLKAAAGGTNTGSLQSALGGTLVIESGAWTNTHGAIEAGNGSTVSVKSGATVTGGTIHAADDAVVEFTYDAALAGATLSTAGTGIVRAVNDETTLDGTASPLVNTGAFEVADDCDVVLKGTIANSGTMTVAGSAHVTALLLDGEVTLDGGGTIALSNYAETRLIGGGANPHLVNLDNTIRGGGWVGQAHNAGADTAVTNAGIIEADQPTPLTLQAEAGGVNTGTLCAGSGGTLVIDGAAWTNTGGVIEALDASTVEVTGGAAVTGGTFRTTGTGLVQIAGSAAVTVASADPLTIDPAELGTVVFEGTLDNALGGTVTKTGGGTLIVNGPQDHGPGALLEVLGGTVQLNTDASGTGVMGDARLSVLVADGELVFGTDQHLDTLEIAGEGTVRFGGANTVAVRHLVMGGTDLGAMTLTPEPATLALLAAAGLGLALRRRR